MLLVSEGTASILVTLIASVIFVLTLVGLWWYKKWLQQRGLPEQKPLITSESSSEPVQLPPEVIEHYKFGELLVVLTPGNETPRLLAFADMSPEDQEILKRSKVLRYDPVRPDHQGLLERKWRKIMGYIRRDREFLTKMTDPTMIAIMNEVINNWDPTYIEEALMHVLEISPKDPLKNTKTEEFLAFLTPPKVKHGARTSLYNLDALT